MPFLSSSLWKKCVKDPPSCFRLIVETVPTCTRQWFQSAAKLPFPRYSLVQLDPVPVRRDENKIAYNVVFSHPFQDRCRRRRSQTIVQYILEIYESCHFGIPVTIFFFRSYGHLSFGLLKEHWLFFQPIASVFQNILCSPLEPIKARSVDQDNTAISIVDPHLNRAHRMITGLQAAVCPCRVLSQTVNELTMIKFSEL